MATITFNSVPASPFNYVGTDMVVCANAQNLSGLDLRPAIGGDPVMVINGTWTGLSAQWYELASISGNPIPKLGWLVEWEARVAVSGLYFSAWGANMPVPIGSILHDGGNYYVQTAFGGARTGSTHPTLPAQANPADPYTSPPNDGTACWFNFGTVRPSTLNHTWIGLSDFVTTAGLGFFQQYPMATNPVNPYGGPGAAYNMVAFHYNPCFSDTPNWVAFVGGGQMSPIIVNTGVPADANGGSHLFQIKQLSLGVLTFYIDHVLVATISYSGLTNQYASVIGADTQDWGDGGQSPSSLLSAWQAGSGYAAGASIGSYYSAWQAIQGGVSGGSNPLPNIFNPFAPVCGQIVSGDGGVTWIAPYGSTANPWGTTSGCPPLVTAVSHITYTWAANVPMTPFHVEANLPYPNRLALWLGPLVGPFIQDGPLGLFDPRRDLDIYVDGVLQTVQTFSFDATNNRYLLYMANSFNLQGVIQVIHHVPDPPFQMTTGWMPDTLYSTGQQIIDPNIHVQGVSIGGGGFSAVGDSVTNVAIASGVLTVQATNSFSAGNTVAFGNLTGAKFLNGVEVVVLSSGLSGSQFTASTTGLDLPISYGPTTDTGNVAKIPVWDDIGSVTVDNQVTWQDLGLIAPLLSGFATIGQYNTSGDTSLPPQAVLSAMPTTAAAHTSITLLWDTVNVAQIEITGNNGTDPPFDSGRITTTGSGVYIVGGGFTVNITLTLTAYDSTGTPLGITSIATVTIT